MTLQSPRAPTSSSRTTTNSAFALRATLGSAFALRATLGSAFALRATLGSALALRATLGLPLMAAGALVLVMSVVSCPCPVRADDDDHAQLAAASEPPIVRADGVAALVGGVGPGEGVQLILRSDVELRARMALIAEEPERALAAELPDALLSATLSELVGEALIAREAERVQISTPTAAEIERAKSRLVIGVGGQERMAALLDRLQAQDQELEAIARRRAIAAAFLSANLEGTTLVTDAEVEERYRADSAAYAGQDARMARDLIRAQLSKEALTRNIERWVRVLRARTQVRVFMDVGES